MKIPFKITSFLYIFICSNNIYAQSFSKNDKIIEAGFGLGIYDSKIYQKSTNNSETNKAAAWVYPFSVEYAVANRLAIGVGYKYSSFIMGNEDTVNTNAKVSGNDIVLKPTFHLLKTKRINMYVGALAGLAWFNFQVNDTNQSFAKGNGSLLAFVFGTRLYVTKNIGLSLNYIYNNYNFVDLTLSNNQGYIDNLDLSLKRGNVGLGLVFKFN
jgi:opacity protein-like surface antigen